MAFFRKQGIAVEGWDPEPRFGATQAPTGVYDCVAVTYVLNVLPTPDERWQALGKASTFVARGGILAVTTRSPKDVAEHARQGHWPVDGDGFRTRSQTFQKGLGKDGDPEAVAHREKVRRGSIAVARLRPGTALRAVPRVSRKPPNVR